MERNVNRGKSRNLSTAEYFEIVQREYIAAKLRSKIYPSPNDKRYWNRVAEYKSKRINEIAARNGLQSIFTNNDVAERFHKEMYNSNNVPLFLTEQDKRYYYMCKQEFSYNGEIWVLDVYNEKENKLYLYSSTRQTYEVVNVGDANRIL